jgi:hypothetical protein
MWYRGYSKSDWVFTMMTLQAYFSTGDGLAVTDNAAFRARLGAVFPPTSWVEESSEGGEEDEGEEGEGGDGGEEDEVEEEAQGKSEEDEQQGFEY